MTSLKCDHSNQPCNYISEVLGHEGKSTPLAELKKRGWVTSLCAGVGGAAPGFALFQVTLGLTSEGICTSLDATCINSDLRPVVDCPVHREEIVATIFEYVELMRATGPEEWRFNEIQNLVRIDWRFLEKIGAADTTIHSASELHLPQGYPEEHILHSEAKFNPQLISEQLDFLEPANCRIFVGTKDPLPGREFWPLRETWFGTEHDIRPLDPSRFKVNPCVLPLKPWLDD